MDRRAVIAGASIDTGVAILAAFVGLPAGARWPAFAAVAGGGLLGGYLAGSLAAGSWRRRIAHGLVAGLLGGVAFGAAVWWSLQPAAANGALWPVNYVLATGAAWFPPGLTARYDAALGIGTAVLMGLLYLVESVVASGAAPGGGVEAVTVRD